MAARVNAMPPNPMTIAKPPTAKSAKAWSDPAEPGSAVLAKRLKPRTRATTPPSITTAPRASSADWPVVRRGRSAPAGWWVEGVGGWLIVRRSSAGCSRSVSRGVRRGCDDTIGLPTAWSGSGTSTPGRLSMTDALRIPADLLPADGRFGSGPSKIEVSHLEALAATGTSLMGTSHRQDPVRDVVARVRDGLAELFPLPDGHEVVLGNGGATAFWDLATYGLIRDRSQHLSFGEFTSKFARATEAAPWLSTPSVIASEPGSRPDPVAEDGVDVYAWAHNE